MTIVKFVISAYYYAAYIVNKTTRRKTNVAYKYAFSDLGNSFFPYPQYRFAFPMTTELRKTTTAKQNMSTKRQKMVVLHISSIDYCYWFFSMPKSFQFNRIIFHRQIHTANNGFEEHYSHSFFSVRWCQCILERRMFLLLRSLKKLKR